MCVSGEGGSVVVTGGWVGCEVVKKESSLCSCHSLIYATAAMASVNFFNKMPKRKHHKNK